jgi:hypothetical protein
MTKAACDVAAYDVVIVGDGYAGIRETVLTH